MATPAQIEANRRNAQKSTGPTSVTGKAVSRFNHLKSGIHAKSQVLPDEDPAELEALAADYREQFQPATPLEVFLVDTIVSADWELRRLRKREPRLWDRDLDSTEDGPMGQALTRLHRRIDATERSYYRALKELQAQIAARTEVDDSEVGQAVSPAVLTNQTQSAACGAAAPVGQAFSSCLAIDSKANSFLGEVNNGQRYHKYAFPGIRPDAIAACFV